MHIVLFNYGIAIDDKIVRSICIGLTFKSRVILADLFQYHDLLGDGCGMVVKVEFVLNELQMGVLTH